MGSEPSDSVFHLQHFRDTGDITYILGGITKIYLRIRRGEWYEHLEKNLEYHNYSGPSQLTGLDIAIINKLTGKRLDLSGAIG